MFRVLLRLAMLTLFGGALAGCNPIPPELTFAASQPFTPEWCNAAKAVPNNGGYLNAVGQCHERGVPGFAKDENVYVFYYSQAARWGNTDAGASLARLNQPVPDSDLYREWQARQERERNTRTIANAIRATAPPPVVVRPAFPLAPIISRPTQVNTSTSTRRNETTSQRRNCVNNVCRTERTTCVNGVCSTQIINN